MFPNFSKRIADSKRELYIQISEASRHSDLRISEISNKLDDTVDG